FEEVDDASFARLNPTIVAWRDGQGKDAVADALKIDGYRDWLVLIVFAGIFTGLLVFLLFLFLGVIFGRGFVVFLVFDFGLLGIVLLFFLDLFVVALGRDRRSTVFS